MPSDILKTGTILDSILEYKRAYVAASMRHTPLAAMQDMAQQADPARDMPGALTVAPNVRVIAEIKQASPSKGILIDPFDAPELARLYASGGAAAISVLTDERFFAGAFHFLTAARAVCDLPMLCKDFFLDPYQIYQARAAGADAILLIVAALPDSRLAELQSLAGDLGMAVLVEVHNESELERARALEPRLIGINNRDLKTFKVDLATTERLAAQAPADSILVGESGVFTPHDVRRLARSGVDAILVGESLVSSDDVVKQVSDLSAIKRQQR